MSDKQKSKRKQAFDIFKEHNGNIDLVEIARLLESPPGTVRGWKSKDKWEDKINGTFQSNKRSAPKEKKERSKARGAPKGNKNAVGNNGGAPKRNKNAVKTGEHETIYAAFLSEQERTLFGESLNSSIVLEHEIHLLRVRELRMLRRLEVAEQGLNENEKTILYELRGRKALVNKRGKKVPIDLNEELTETEVRENVIRKIDDILRIEDALTRVSSQLARVVKQYEELDLIHAKTRYTIAQTEKALLANDRGNRGEGDFEGQTIINIIDDIG